MTDGVETGSAGVTTTPRTRYRWSQRVVLVLAVVAPLVVLVWRTKGAFRFYQDDLLQFAVAQESGLSWDLLGLDVFQHFAPVNRVLHLLLVHGGDLSVDRGLALAVGAAAAFLLSAAWLMHELELTFARRVVGLVAIGFSITLLDTVVWADAAFHVLPALVATDVVVAAHLRAGRTGRRRWGAVAVLALAVGAMTQERVLFALPLLVLVDWFLVGAGQPVRTRCVRLRRSVPVLVAAGIVALAIGAFIYLEYASGVTARPSPGVTVRTALGALTQGIFPPWLGVTLPTLSPLPVQGGILAAMVAVCVALVRLRRRNADPLVFLAAVFVLYYGFLSFSPILNASLVDSTALRLHNGAYLLVPTVLAAATLVGRRGHGHDVGAVDSGRPRTGSAARVGLAAGLLAVLLTVTGGWFTERAWTDERQAHAYLQALADGRPAWSDPQATLVPLLVPPTIARDWAEVYGRQEFFLRFYEAGWVPQELGDDPVVVDATGRVRPVALEQVSGVEPVSDACGDQSRSELSVEGDASGAPLFLQLTYRTGGPSQVTATADSGTTGDAAAIGNWAVPLQPGEHTVVVPLHTGEVSSVLLGWSGGAQHCVESASVVRPVFVDGGTCTAMDEYGAPQGRVDCPESRRT